MYPCVCVSVRMCGLISFAMLSFFKSFKLVLSSVCVSVSSCVILYMCIYIYIYICVCVCAKLTIISL